MFAPDAASTGADSSAIWTEPARDRKAQNSERRWNCPRTAAPTRRKFPRSIRRGRSLIAVRVGVCVGKLRSGSTRPLEGGRAWHRARLLPSVRIENSKNFARSHDRSLITIWAVMFHGSKDENSGAQSKKRPALKFGINIKQRQPNAQSSDRFERGLPFHRRLRRSTAQNWSWLLRGTIFRIPSPRTIKDPNTARCSCLSRPFVPCLRLRSDRIAARFRNTDRYSR